MICLFTCKVQVLILLQMRQQSQQVLHYLNIHSLTDHMNKDLEAVGKWVTKKQNFDKCWPDKVIVGDWKTHCQEITWGHSCQNLNIKNSEIIEVSELELLGLTYDQNRTFEPHIDQLCKSYQNVWASQSIPKEATKGNILQWNYQT